MTKLGEYVLSGQEINSNVVRSIDGNDEGGGDSDYSTAKVTIIDNTNQTAPVLYAPLSAPDGATSANIGDAEIEYDVILENGNCILHLNEDNDFTVSGNAEIETVPPFGLQILHITGDCTVTISDAQ